MAQLNLKLLTGISELSVVHAGMEQCQPGHAFGPAVRDYYLFHCIQSGCGFFQTAGKTYTLKGGQGFMIFPDQVTYYEADLKDPWHYTWIAFKGERAAEYVSQAGFSILSPIMTVSPSADAMMEPFSIASCFEQIERSLDFQKGREQRLLGLLYLFLSGLMAANPDRAPEESKMQRKDHYVRKAKDYMEMNYAHKMTISNLSAHIGLDRSYFGQLFKSETGLSPQQYLMRLRMEKACRLMDQSDLTIRAVAHSVGYDDPLLFSRMFRRVMGYPPSAHRNRGYQKQIKIQEVEI